METNGKQEIGSRVSELMFRLEKNQSSFAEVIGTSQTNVRNVIKGLVKPKYEFLESILKAYPNISKDWLMEGKGEMFLTDQRQEAPSLPSSYLMDTLARIEESFKSTLDENRRVIEDQRFIIDTLKSQVAALSSVNGPFTEVSEVPPVPFVKKRMQIVFRAENPAFLSIG